LLALLHFFVGKDSENPAQLLTVPHRLENTFAVEKCK